MNLQRPFYRMFRPNKQKGGYFGDYAIDHRNILNWSSPIRAFNLIVEDFKKICEYIDPSDENFGVYSHRLYEIFIRSCIELESNMRAILKANGYAKKGDWDITDYKKLEPALKLSNYKVLINFWNNGRGMNCTPFQNWADNKSGMLVWYREYNEVKHHREEKFYLASLENLLESICGLFVILFSQYGVQIFNPYQIVSSYDSDDLNGVISKSSSIFGIKPPEWHEDEKYDFNWDIIKIEENPFQKLESF